MITAEELDKIVTDFDAKPEEIDAVLLELESTQSNLLDILIGSHAEMLGEEELDYLLFLFMVIYFGFKKKQEIKIIEEEEIVSAEEKVWGLINQHKQFEAIVEKLYENENREGLIEFIEVSLEPDDENEFHISETGRIIMLAVLVSEIEILSAQ